MDLDKIIKVCHMLHLFWLIEPWMCRYLSNEYFSHSLLSKGIYTCQIFLYQQVLGIKMWQLLDKYSLVAGTSVKELFQFLLAVISALLWVFSLIVWPLAMFCMPHCLILFSLFWTHIVLWHIPRLQFLQMDPDLLVWAFKNICYITSFLLNLHDSQP
jgi:hypothetical protein